MSADYASTLRRAALWPRVLTALVGIPLIVGAAWLGGVWWVGLVGIVMAIGATEFGRLHSWMTTPARAVMILGTVAVVLIAAWLPDPPPAWSVMLALAVLVVGMWANLTRNERTAAWRSWVAVVTGVVYLGLPGGALVRWRMDAAVAALVWFFLLIWANDIASYFVGLAIGRHKLAPQISPGKSWEGAVAGVVAAAAVGLAAAAVLGFTPLVGIVFGVVSSIASQAADLLESALKRRAGVKDSGTLLPGHGGVLDRFDGVLIAAPVAYLLLRVWAR